MCDTEEKIYYLYSNDAGYSYSQTKGGGWLISTINEHYIKELINDLNMRLKYSAMWKFEWLSNGEVLEAIVENAMEEVLDCDVHFNPKIFSGE